MDPIRVGVVDDDVSVRNGLSRLLRSANFDATTFASGEECLAAPGLEAIACLLVDINLSGMNGFELLHWLKQAGCRIPVILITADDEPVTRDALLAAGSPPCLRKPFDANALLASINHSLGLAALKR